MAKFNQADRAPRGQTAIICKVLQHKDGYTAQELLAETGGITPHNSYSLKLIGDRFGFNLVTYEGSEYEDGLKRYLFAPKASAKRSVRAAAATRKAAPRKVASRKPARKVLIPAYKA